MAETAAILTARLSKSYGQIRALRGVELIVPAGMMYGFLGPNGAGKTTAIRCMLDLIRPDGGTIRILGLDPQLKPVEVRQKVGYLPGELTLEANLTVQRVLHYFRDLRGHAVDWEYTRQLAERLELDLRLQVKNLSKGNKQKVGIVLALMSRPELLLLDEPTSGLDPLMQQEVYQMLHEAQRDGATIFFSSHIISEVEAIANRIGIIRNGIIVEEVDPSQMVDMALRRLHLRFLEPVDAAQLDDIAGVTVVTQSGLEATVQVEGEMDALVKALGAYPVRDIETERPSLEEVFLQLYADKDQNVPMIDHRDNDVRRV